MSTRHSLVRWIAMRLALAVPVVLGVTALTFVLVHAAPGDPIYLLAGDGGSASYYAEMRVKYGLDQSFAEQFLRYVRAVLKGDLGHSFMYQSPVLRVLLDHAPASLLLGGTALVLATLIGTAAGLICAARQGRFVDRILRVGASTIYAAPVFWTGQMLMLVVALKLGLLPIEGFSTARETLSGLAYVADVARHLAIPSITVALPLAAVVARVSRASLLDSLQEPFVQAARARGLSPTRALLHHAAPHAAVPVVALVGQHAAQVAAGAALTEALFGWPGVGYLVFHASLHRDYPLVTGAFIFIAASVVFFNAATDAICAWLDPRIPLT